MKLACGDTRAVCSGGDALWLRRLHYLMGVYAISICVMTLPVGFFVNWTGVVVGVMHGVAGVCAIGVARRLPAQYPSLVWASTGLGIIFCSVAVWMLAMCVAQHSPTIEWVVPGSQLLVAIAILRLSASEGVRLHYRAR